VTFLHPEFLYLMLPPVFILFYFILTQEGPTARLFGAEIFARLQVKEKRLSARQRNALYLGVFVLLITAMAQPVIIEAKVRVKAPERTLMVVLDISASMRTADLYPSRLAVAREKLLQIIDAALTERIGIMAFGRDVYVVSPPSSDMRVLRQMAERFEPNEYAEAGTDIGAMLAAADGFLEKGPRREIVLLSDGGDGRKFSAASSFAREHDMRISVIGVGTPQGAPLIVDGKPVMRNGRPVVTGLNPKLPELAGRTGGYYIDAATGSQDVSALMKALRRGAPGGEDGMKVITRYGQLFILPLASAMIMLLFATSSMSRRERVAVPPVILLGVLLFANVSPLRAELFDYELLDSAKRLYGAGEYRRAANAYFRYAKRNGDDAQALYDSAHALYRAGDYAAAAALWSEIHSKERLLQYKTLHNLGNAEAMQGSEAHLLAAMSAYQKALNLQNDPQTRENMEAVRARLMQMMRKKTQGDSTQPPGESKPSQSATGAQAQTSGSATPEKTEQESEAAKPSEATGETKTVQMSDYEAAMWMKSLGQKSPTRLYKISPERAKGGQSVSPW